MINPMSKNKSLQTSLFLDGPEEILFTHSLSLNQSGFGYQNLKSNNKLQGSVKRKQQQWYLDSACSRHMTGDKRSFLSLKNIKGGNVAFGNGKSGEIQGIGKVGSMDTHAIQNVYYVNGAYLKYVIKETTFSSQKKMQSNKLSDWKPGSTRKETQECVQSQDC